MSVLCLATLHPTYHPAFARSPNSPQAKAWKKMVESDVAAMRQRSNRTALKKVGRGGGGAAGAAEARGLGSPAGAIMLLLGFIAPITNVDLWCLLLVSSCARRRWPSATWPATTGMR